ncbi:MAG: succinate CoA transferase [Puniceicoccales bacterium]|jgi:succinate CoA transferase|nr:succinate CoA transferase [Puniceicoccales bacterium]
MKEITADDVANFVKNGDRVAFGGFTPAGTPKVSASAIAKKAEEEHVAGKPFKIHVLTGASTGDDVDGALARADAIISRVPYQSDSNIRNLINEGRVHYCDIHISHYAQQVKQKIFGEIDLAIVEAADISDSGEILFTTAIGVAPTFCRHAKKIAVELNEYHPKKIRRLHDIYETELVPHTKPIPLVTVRDRIGTETIKVDPAKIIGIVRTSIPSQVKAFSSSDKDTNRIGENIAKFLSNEIRSGRILPQFPVQSGVGNVANSVLEAMSTETSIIPYTMYSEVLQDSVIEAIKSGNILFASGAALTVTSECLSEIYDNYDFFKTRLILRPQEISNHPEIILRLGLVSINTALEVDICGSVNSTHVLGSNVMNGVGGAADFARNSQISIFACKSTAKDGKISSIVPFCSHVDQSEHSVKIIVTECGIADLRGKDPRQRAQEIINNCVHPDYKDLLSQYLSLANRGHIPFSLANVFKMYETFTSEGDMRKTNWSM